MKTADLLVTAKRVNSMTEQVFIHIPNIPNSFCVKVSNTYCRIQCGYLKLLAAAELQLPFSVTLIEEKLSALGGILYLSMVAVSCYYVPSFITLHT